MMDIQTKSRDDLPDLRLYDDIYGRIDKNTKPLALYRLSEPQHSNFLAVYQGK